MKKCANCSFENIDTAKHCINCGARLDGNLYCPKCHEVVSINDEVCPHCGTKLPKEEKDNTSPKAQEIESKKERIDPVFQRVFIIVSLVSFFLAASLAFANFFTLRINDKDYTINLISLIQGYFNDDPTLDVLTRSLVLGVVSLNIIITVLFSVKGIIRCFRDLKKKPIRCNSHKELGMVLASNAITTFSFFAFIKASETVSFKFENTLTTVTTLLSVVAFMMIYLTFRSFTKSRPLKFVEKIIFSFVIYLSILVLLGCGLPAYFINGDFGGYVYEGNISFFINIIRTTTQVVGDTNGEWIVLTVLSSIYLLFAILIALFAASIVAFVTPLFFSKLEGKKAPRVPLTFVGLSILVMSAINLVISIFVVTRYGYLVGTTNIFPVSSIVTLSVAIILFAIIIVSLNMTRKIIKQDKIIASKANIEKHIHSEDK